MIIHSSKGKKSWMLAKIALLIIVLAVIGTMSWLSEDVCAEGSDNCPRGKVVNFPLTPPDQIDNDAQSWCASYLECTGHACELDFVQKASPPHPPTAYKVTCKCP